jgi:hypothetical protein
MIWDKADKAAFAIRGHWVVAWFRYANPSDLKLESQQYKTDVDQAGNTWRNSDVDATNVPLTDAEKLKNKADIRKRCMKKTAEGKYYSSCVVDAELAAHNDIRLGRKDTPALKHDVAASVKIQEMLDDD